MAFIEWGLSVYFHLIRKYLVIDENDVEILCAIEEILIRIPRLRGEIRFNNFFIRVFSLVSRLSNFYQYYIMMSGIFID